MGASGKWGVVGVTLEWLHRVIFTLATPLMASTARVSLRQNVGLLLRRLRRDILPYTETNRTMKSDQTMNTYNNSLTATFNSLTNS